MVFFRFKNQIVQIDLGLLLLHILLPFQKPFLTVYAPVEKRFQNQKIRAHKRPYLDQYQSQPISILYPAGISAVSWGMVHA
jgi:hypothetical protein